MFVRKVFNEDADHVAMKNGKGGLIHWTRNLCCL